MNENLLNRYQAALASVNTIKENQRYVDIRQKELQTQIFDYLDLIEDKTGELEATEKAILLMQQVSDDRNSSSKDALRDLINWTLAKVFPSSSYTVHINELSDARSGKKMEIYLTDNTTGQVNSLRHNLGNSILQTIAFLLRLILIKISGCSKILMLDEFFSGISDKEAIRTFGEVLTSIAENEGFQIIITEQLSAVSADNPDFKFIDVALHDKDEGLVLERMG